MANSVTNIQFTPGVLPNDPKKARLYFRMFRKADAVAPAVVNFEGTPNLGMLGNDLYGDCVYAMVGHAVDEITFYGQSAEYVVSTTEALNAYAAQTGFTPKDPSTDQGDTVQHGLEYLTKTGFGGHTTVAFAQLDPNNMADVKLAVAEFGAVYVGFAFPASAMTQFNQGKPWDALRSDGGIEGGHAVLLVGYDASYLYVITWGKVQKMTQAFWNKYVVADGGEAWTAVSLGWVNDAKGTDPEGVDKYALGAQFAALTGQPNPFPGPVTPPNPPVDPPVNPPVGPSDADKALDSAFKTWAHSVGL